MIRLGLAALIALLAFCAPASAERVILGLSTTVIPISSNFTGAQLALFGVIEPDDQTGARRGAYDVVVLVRGPARVQTVRRKDAFGPFWINASSRTYVASASYYAVLSNRPAREAVIDPVRLPAQIGLDTLELIQPQAPNNPADDASFREAFVRLKGELGLYVEAHGPGAVAMLAPNVFRATVTLPPTIPTGFYSVEAMVLSEGFIVGRERAEFVIEKTGFEAQVFALSREQPILYGLATIVLALGTGWIAGAVFRRN